jgi:hypothetical protein
MSRAVTRPFNVLAQTQSHFIAIVELEHHTFEVQQNVDDVFLTPSTDEYSCKTPAMVTSVTA